MKHDLLNCPFCGSKAKLAEQYEVIYDFPVDGNCFYNVKIYGLCENGRCFASGAAQGASTNDIDGKPNKERDDVERARVLASSRWNARSQL